MFLTCLLNSRPPASFGILFHCFAAKYLKEFNPCFVVFTFGSGSLLLPLKLYLLFLILTIPLMNVGAVPWKQAFIVINMSWTQRFSNVVRFLDLFAVAVHDKLMFYLCKYILVHAHLLCLFALCFSNHNDAICDCNNKNEAEQTLDTVHSIVI